jgi:hypothetical protein
MGTSILIFILFLQLIFMQEVRDALMEAFNIQKFKNECNHPNCNAKPDKEIHLYEYNMKKGKDVFAKLYLCDAHVGKVNEILKKIKQIVPSSIIMSEIKDL